jgi:hypothetical protein
LSEDPDRFSSLAGGSRACSGNRDPLGWFRCPSECSSCGVGPCRLGPTRLAVQRLPGFPPLERRETVGTTSRLLPWTSCPLQGFIRGSTALLRSPANRAPRRGNPPGLCCSPAHEGIAVFCPRGLPFPARAHPAFLRLGRAGPRATSITGRVCFAPATLLSFLLQGFVFLPEIRGLVSEPVPPLLLGTRANPGSSASKVSSLWTAVSPFGRHFQADVGPLPSWSFSPLRLSLPLPEDSASRALPPSSFPRHLSPRGDRRPGPWSLASRGPVSRRKPEGSCSVPAPLGFPTLSARRSVKSCEAFRWQT